MKIVHKGQDSASDLSVVRAARRFDAVQLQVRVEQGKLVAEATGAWPILEFEKGNATPLVAISGDEFPCDDGIIHGSLSSGMSGQGVRGGAESRPLGTERREVGAPSG